MAVIYCTVLLTVTHLKKKNIFFKEKRNSTESSSRPTIVSFSQWRLEREIDAHNINIRLHRGFPDVI